MPVYCSLFEGHYRVPLLRTGTNELVVTGPGSSK